MKANHDYEDNHLDEPALSGSIGNCYPEYGPSAGVFSSRRCPNSPWCSMGQWAKRTCRRAGESSRGHRHRSRARRMGCHGCCNRLAGWNGVVTASDCPAGQPSQIGAFDFATVPCATVSAYFPGGAPTVLAFVDYFPSVCAQCGTKSISVNLAFAWAVGGAPLAGQYHLRSVLAHKFGHVLGLAHMSGGACVASSPSCAASPGRETMGGTFYPGPAETCEADVAPNDVSSANALY